MQEQTKPEPEQRPDSAGAASAESIPTPPPPAQLAAPQPSGGDPFLAMAAPAAPATVAPKIELPRESPAPPPVIELPQSTPPAPPPVIEVEATQLSASDTRRPFVDASLPPPPPIDVKPAASQPAPAAPPPPASSTTPPFAAPPPATPPPPPAAPLKAPKEPGRFRRHAWAILCHLLLVLVIPTVFLGSTLTFLIWQIKGKTNKHIEDQGREALNFQINVAVVTAILAASCLGAPLLVIVWFVAIVMSIIAARHAFHGENYRYPWVLRIVSH